MDGDVLSQAEVESLLAAIERPEAQRRSGAQLFAKTVPYDFKRPERVGKEQMRSLQTMYEGFSRNFGAALSALLRAIVEVKLTSVDQLTYSEFVFSLENPTCFNIIQAEPLEGHYPHRLVGKIGIDATAKAHRGGAIFERAWPKGWGKVKLEDFLD